MKKALSAREVQNHLRGSSDPLGTLSVLRGKINPSDLSSVVAWLPKLRHNGRGIFQGQYPAKIGDFRQQRILDSVSPDREFAWARHIFSTHTERICAFIQFTREYERRLVSGRYEQCTEVLNDMDSQCGLSLWSLENRIALLQLAEGLEKQKAYVSDVRGAAGESIIAFIVFYLSQRNEDTSTPEHFVSRFTTRLESWSLPVDLKSYLLFRIANRLSSDQVECGHILRFESISPVVDFYDTFIRLSQEVVLRGADPLRSRILAELKKLLPHIHDTRITKILFVGSRSVDMVLDSDSVDLAASEAHSEGKYEEVCDVAKRNREEGSVSFNHWLIEAEARNETKLNLDKSDRALAARIVNMVSSVLAKEDEANSAVLGLSRLALNLRLLSFSTAIVSFLEEEHSCDPTIPSPLGLKAFLESHFLDPGFLGSFSDMRQREAYARCLLSTYGEGRAIVTSISELGLADLLVGACAGINSDGPQAEAYALGQIRNYITTGDLETALTDIRQLGQSDRLRTRRCAKRFEGYCLLALGRLDEVVQFTVTQYLSDRGMIYMLPVKECVRILDDAMREKLAARLSTPILFDLYSRFIADDLGHIRANSYEDFLLANMLERPSQLAGLESGFVHEELVYYLRFICVPSVMNVSIAYASTRDLEEERLAVDLLLSRLDPESSGIYEAEVREITRNQIIHQCVRQVDQSKIFVDAVALRRWADQNLKESFNRYQALKKAGISIGDIDFMGVMQDLRAGRPIPREFLELPKNEAVDLLVQIVRSFLNECTLNPEYGLDCYLSIRIRHGTLSGQLRNPLEMERLITQRISDLPSYQSNEYWTSRLAGLWPSAVNSIDERLSRFSRDYDAFIARFANELIQIHGEHKKDGLFVVVMNVVQIRYLAAQAKDATAFGHFIDTFFELFWESIQQCLVNICHVVDTSLKAEVSHLFTELEEDISKIHDNPAITDLKRAIRSGRTSAVYALDIVKGWFHLAQPLIVPDLTFDNLIDIGLQSVKNIHSDFLPSMVRKLPDLPPIKGGLILFSDIFFIVFDNIRRHSSVKFGRPNVEIAVENLGDRLRISVKNEVGVDANVDGINSRVAQIRKAIEDGAYQEIIRSEGGTGFGKLWKLINREGKPNKSLEFGFGNDGWFFVSFEVPVVILEGEQDHRAEASEVLP